jgi:hypothetical protein
MGLILFLFFREESKRELRVKERSNESNLSLSSGTSQKKNNEVFDKFNPERQAQT